MNTIRISMSIMSYLSDAQAMIELGMLKEANARINCAKSILLDFPNTNEEVDKRAIYESIKEWL